MKKELRVDDVTMIMQWLAVVGLTPFILLPLFTPREQVSFALRFLLVAGMYVGSGIMTFVYLRYRERSRRAAGMVVNILAAADVVIITLCLIFWPRFLPELFWVFPLLVIVVGTRFGYKETAVVTLALGAIYAATVAARLGDTLPARTIVGDTLVRIIFMLLIAVAAVYVTQREKRQRRDAGVLSDVAAAIGSTLETEGLLEAVVEGTSRVTGSGRSSAFLLSEDGKWAIPQCTTETDPALKKKFFAERMDLGTRSVASKVAEEREAIVVTDMESNPLVGEGWVDGFDTGALLVLPLMLRNETKALVFVEKRRPRDYFLDREVKICKMILSQASAGLENALRYSEEQLRRSEQEMLYRSSRELGSTLEVDEVVETACKLAIDSTGSGACTAFLTEQDTGRLLPYMSVGAGGTRRLGFPKGSEMYSEELKNLFSLAKRPPALVISRPGDSSALPPFLRAEGTVMLVPFYSHGRMTGLFAVSDAEGRDYTGTQKAKVAAVAGETSLSILNARLYERIKADAAQMSSLIQLTNAIGSSPDLNSILAIALDVVRHLFDCNAGLIYRIEEEDNTLRYVDSFGYSSSVLEKISSPPFTPARDCWTVTEGRMIAVDDLSVTKPDCWTLAQIGQGSTICVGMRVADRTLGVLHIRSERSNAFGEEDQQLILAIADQVALAMQRALLFEEINRLAATDPLTGVYNVRRLEEELQGEITRAHRYSRPVAFLMVDVDNLKSYNDTFGHQKGDEVLLRIASILDENTRETDKVFRYGGDEFCIILPETDSSEAVVVADKIRKSVSEFPFPGMDRLPDREITISVGVASYPGDADDADDLIRKADEALYAAKQEGRNSVAAAG